VRFILFYIFSFVFIFLKDEPVDSVWKKKMMMMISVKIEVARVVVPRVNPPLLPKGNPRAIL
jgi:hypothetical protein